MPATRLLPQHSAPAAGADFIVSRWILLSLSLVKGHGLQWSLESEGIVSRETYQQPLTTAETFTKSRER